MCQQGRDRMPFELKEFRECSHTDEIFNSLKDDYDGFETWFNKKSKSGETAYVYVDKGSIQAFLYVKDWEDEAVGDLPKKPRIKIGTMKVCDTHKGKRLGEGAIGLALWKWQQSDLDEIYVTVYPKHTGLIELLKSYGFRYGTKKGEEDVYIKDKTDMDYSDPKKAFPYLDPNFTRGRYIPINDTNHDRMFQNSELKNTDRVIGDLSVSNGMTKVYIATPIEKMDYKEGDAIFIYRRYTGKEHKPSYKSAVTSYCTVLRVIPVKEKGKVLVFFREYRNMAGNKTVYTDEELSTEFRKQNVYLIELLYNGYFGAGNNVNYSTLVKEGLFKDEHPYKLKLTREETFKLLKMGGKNENDIIVNKSRAC